ncbi:hypothetical protein [Phaeobacter piscinae]|uniref:hypothetical protein n=1 Tax=Phaeobacter piscinae TaxID=1580596 RepID=UPI000BBFCEE8|nr:hypothetical protein [Phaeobacter piscinae]ATG41769.1 hypothetical protein PhaeoP14_03737 [Phaeobacter piscinae]AUR38192.1 hypothetical protein PhaeoP18_03976 [Phaeobacter piscinae]
MTGRYVKPPMSLAHSRQAAGFKKSTLRRVERRGWKELDRQDKSPSERLYDAVKSDMQTADYALKAAALICVAGTLSRGAFIVLRTASNFWHVMLPLVGFACSLALFFSAVQLMGAFALSLDKAGRLRELPPLAKTVAVGFIALLTGALCSLVWMVWMVGLRTV